MRQAISTITTVKLIFRAAGIWGFLTLTPMLFLRSRVETMNPPRLTHVEYYYGFIVISLVFQLIFFLIAKDPIYYRQLIHIAILQKFVYPIVIFGLLTTHQAPPKEAFFAGVDFLFGLLFILALLKTPKQA